MTCDVCAYADEHGSWAQHLRSGSTHCRDCHRTFRGHLQHCVRCHETFGGTSAADKHNPGGMSVSCHDPAARGLRITGSGESIAWSGPGPVATTNWAHTEGLVDT